jgi:hypothetical protein
MHPQHMHIIEAEDPVGGRPRLPGPGPIPGHTEGGRSRGLFHGLGNAARHIPGPFVEQGVLLHYQEGVVVLLQDGPELDEVKGSWSFDPAS